ncbi:MAG: dTDP-glucose 4,6-dehydratase [Dehalococcoidia bacterium]|nr:MAG: dTDP-glucose 4,6-dehydratase [Dehalococcoidia bacterium]
MTDRDTSIGTPDHGVGELWGDVLDRFLSRRGFLKASAALGAATAASGLALNAPAADAAGLDFTPIPGDPPDADRLVVAPGYRMQVLIRWGDPILPGGEPWSPERQSAEMQERQFGYNCDFVGYLPLPYGSNNPNRGLLVVNHEYTNPELMFANFSLSRLTREQADIQIAAHGISVVEVERRPDGTWRYVPNSPYNRRITANTPIQLTGPAAGHPWLVTSQDPTGSWVLGTLNNCAGGKTPWGTVLSGEENFNGYFDNAGQIPTSDPRRASMNRYGIPTGMGRYQWSRYHDRFDVAKEPNESFKHGWVVEIDPYDPTSTPKKRTALGRRKNEAATYAINPDGRLAIYIGDDERFDYAYKFVPTGRFNPNNRAANMDLLDSGTLYVAKFNDDGTGQWLPLVWGEGPLTPANGFGSQADILINTRQAADALGATKMDRPEDFEWNPVNGKVYLVLTNNSDRGAPGRAGPDAANPRPNNRAGHIIEITEANNDVTATTFTWNIFILAGRPSDPTSWYAGYPKDRVSTLGAPDNIVFDQLGNMWVGTDGASSAVQLNDGLFAVPLEGSERGHLQQFFSAVAGAEVCGPEFNTDETTLFLAVQHPGEDGTVENPISTWPDGLPYPRPSVITIVAENGGRIGMAGSTGRQAASRPTGGLGDLFRNLLP